MNSLINNVGNGIKDFVIAEYAEFTTKNTSFTDESIFEYVVRNSDTVPYCCVVGFGGGNDLGRSEFASSMFALAYDVQFFHVLAGADDIDYANVILKINDFASEMLYLVSTDSTLGGIVMDSSVGRITRPLVYARTPITKFYNVTVRLEVTENIS